MGKPLISLFLAALLCLSLGGSARAGQGGSLGSSLGDTQEALGRNYRLPPDRRMLRAVGDIHRLLTGRVSVPAQARFDPGDRKWHVRHGNTAVGTLTEMPDFDEGLMLLSEWATGLLREHPLPAPEDKGPGQKVPLFAEDALPVLLALDQKDEKDLPAAARALTSLAFSMADLMGVGDGVSARALAVLAVLRAQGQPSPRETGLLAHTMGYGRAARAAAATLPEDDPLRAYLEDRDDDLVRLAQTPQDHLLRWRQLCADADKEREEAYRLAHLPDRQLGLSVLSGRILMGEFDTDRELGLFMPILLLRDVEAHGTPKATGVHSLKELRAALLQRVSLYQGSPGVVLGHFDAELSKLPVKAGDPFLGPDVARGFYQALMNSAIYALGIFYLDKLSSEQDAARFAATMAGAKGTSFAPCAALFAVLSGSKSGQDLAQGLLATLGLKADFGGTPFGRVHEQVIKLARLDDPMRVVATRRLAARLDSRPWDRHLLGEAAYSALYDLPLAEHIVSGLPQLEAARHGGTDVWYARFSGDGKALSAIADNPAARPQTRLSAIFEMERLKLLTEEEALRRMQALLGVDRDNVHLRLLVVEHLEAHKDHGAGRLILGDWLAHHRGAGGFERIFAHTALAKQFYLDRRYKEAWDAVQPVLSSWQGEAMERGALILAALGRTEEATKIGRDLIGRYPDSKESLGACAEVLWRTGQVEQAARLLLRPPRPLLEEDWRWIIGKRFAAAFGDDAGGAKGDEPAVAALRAMQLAGIGARPIEEMAIHLMTKGRAQLAFRILSQLRLSGGEDVELALHAYEAGKEAGGSAAAATWMRRRLRPMLAAGMRLDMLSGVTYSHGAYEILWDVLPEPSTEPPEIADGIWLFRAAGYLQEGPNKDPAHLALLRRYFTGPGPGNDRYRQLGRYLLGMVPEAVVLRLGVDDHTTCEVAYYAGVHALSQGRMRDASDFFRAAMETGSRRDGEYHWALNQLFLWQNQGKALTNPVAPAPGPAKSVISATPVRRHGSPRRGVIK